MPLSTAVKEAVSREQETIARIRGRGGKVLVGQQQVLDGLLIGLLNAGHILLEGVPGLAKTTAVLSLARATSLSFQRLQFTPDLLPADLIGTQLYNPKDMSFVVKKGPIFANLILADEINRAPAKVQSALLEAMQERQVTIGDETFKLPEPFLVLATQNPIEQEGTYPLPEAQVDRFLAKLVVDYPSRAEEAEILERMAVAERPAEIASVVDGADLQRLRQVCQSVYLDDKVKHYILDIVAATRKPAAIGFAHPEWIAFGASPRAGIFLVQAARSQAFLEGRAYVVPHDVKRVALPVLRHRVLLSYEAEAAEQTADDVVSALLEGGRAMIPELLAEVRRIQIVTRRKVDSVFAGGYRSSFRGTGMEFEEVREYSPGDDVRAIDWKVTARSGRPFIKVFREERELQVVLAVDISGSQDFGSTGRTKQRLAAEVAGLLAFTAQQSGDKVGLLLFSDRVERYLPPRKGRGHALRLVRELLGFKRASRGTDLRPALEHLLQVLKRRATVFLVSDLRARGYERTLKMLARRHDLVVLRTCDRRERELEDCGLVTVECPESGELRTLDTGSPAVRSALARAAASQERAWQEMLLRARVDVAELDTEVDLAAALHRLFQRRERRQSR